MESSRYARLFQTRVHAWTHVSLCAATATYRLHPLVLLNPSKPIPPHLAQKFASCFSPGVVKVSPDGEVCPGPSSSCTRAIYSRVLQVSIDDRHLRKETMSREVLRHKEFEGSVELKRVRDWFICMPPTLLF